MKFKYFNLIIASLLLTTIFYSCKKNDPDQWLEDNVTVIGKYPVIAKLGIVPPQTTAVTAGSSINLDLRYWSDDPIDKINLKDSIGTSNLKQVSSTPYQKAYSAVSRTDSLVIPYQVPGGTASGTKIILRVEVVNKNTLSAFSTVTLNVQ